MEPVYVFGLGQTVGRSMVNRTKADAAGRGSSPVVTVLMSVRDVPGRILAQAVDSVLAQTFRDFEFLIYDDGGEDPVVFSALEEYAQRDARIRLRHQPPRGLTRTLNIGLAEAQGRYVARHDADDWSEPDRLAKQLDFLERHTNVAVCGSNAKMHQENGAPLWTTRLPLEPGTIANALWNGNTFVHGATMFRADAARAIGGYREEFACSQDYDFFWRLCEFGGGANLAAPLYHYRFRKDAVSARRAQEQACVHNVTQMLARARQTGANVDVRAALEAQRAAFALSLRARLKQADHRMLAGDYGGAIRAYSSLLSRYPAHPLAWGKWIRWFVFLAAPPARSLCFR